MSSIRSCGLPEDLLGVLELSYNEMKHTGSTAASWVCSVTAAALLALRPARKCSPGVAHFHAPCVWQLPSGKYYHSKFTRDLCDIWDMRGSV